MPHETSVKSLGDVLRVARVAKGLSLRDLGKKLGKTP
jgi:cytoskeletal protein RodZ